MGAQLSNQSSFTYQRREPEKTLLYSALASGVESWLAERKEDTSKTPLPEFVEKEFRGFLRCGLLQYGFVVLECPGCKTNLPVAYSCKFRGFCPSCGAKRDGAGNRELNSPPIRGANDWYLLTQLKNFKNKVRTG